MDRLIRCYADKLVKNGFAAPGAPLLGAVDDEILWNREDPLQPLLADVFAGLSIQSLLYSLPAEPYRTAIAWLAAHTDGTIYPMDTETRTFLHDLPVAPALTAAALVEVLKERKGVILPGGAIVTFGTVSPEQAFVTFCSVCFSCFVKFFGDCLAARRQGGLPKGQEEALAHAVAHLDTLPPVPPRLRIGPWGTEAEVLAAMAEAGKATVACRLVDSYFGNLSCLSGKTLYISQTGSSLDELEGCIDAVPLDGSSCAGMTASSELSAHRQIVLATGRQVVLHGHPRFSVTLSMDCDRPDCPERGFCHLRCPEQRQAAGTPVVPGEVGTGRYGLCHTVPPVLQGQEGVIVYGHGVFTAGEGDFNGAFARLFAIEQACRQEYFRRIREGG
jgi:ribulose-5-phosphate 4-epimerase/fuculose-1-phosphate aldolase